jgi:YVTN family beta-propeller protein
VFFRLLGPLEVTDGNRSIPLGEGRQRIVLVFLLLRRNEAVASDRLVDALWGEAPPPTAAKVLQNHVRQLRRALGDREGQRLQTRGHAYALRVEAGEVDLDRFEELVREGGEALERARPADAAAGLREALALWRGPPLADVAYEPFAQGEIARLEERRTVTLEQRIDADLALGRHAQVVGELEALVAEHPLRERLRAQLMVALYRCGRQADALDAYPRARRALLDELGVEPGPALRELQAAILRQDPELAPAPGAWPRPLRSSRRRVALLAVGGALLLAAAIAATLVELGSGERPIRVESNSVAVIDPRRDAVVGRVSVGARPGDISAGAGGVWVANLDDDDISQIDPRKARVMRTLSTGTSVDAMTTAGEAVWTVDSPHATALRVNPAFRDVVRRVRLGPNWAASTTPSPIAAGDGSVWTTAGGAAVARIRARPQRPERVDVGTEPAGIAIGAGATWVADDLDDTVTRIDPAGTVTATIPVGRGASAIAVGDSAVWVANTLDNTVTRIDPSTNATRITIPVGAAPTGIAISPDAVWVANSGDGSVSRIDPRRNRVTKTIAVGGSPEDVAVSGGRVWVTVQAAAPRPAAPGLGGKLRIVQEKDFDATDPALLAGYGPQAGQLAFATGAKLLDFPDRPARAGTRLVPEVAAAMPTVSRDGRTYTFTIRPGFRFSPPSNRPVTALAFQRAFERLLSPRMKSDVTDYAASFFSDVVGFRAYRSGRSGHLVGVTATATTLTIRLVRAVPSLPARLAMPFLSAVPPDTPVRAGGVDAIPSAGPYYIASHIPKRELVLRRNPNYHGPRPHRLDEIDYRFGAPPTRAVALVESGDAEYANATIGDQHFARAVPPALQADLDRRYGAHSPAARAGRQRYFINRTLAVLYYVLNSRRPLFASERMRQAVNFAIDRAALARNVHPTSATPTDQYLPTAMPGFRDADIYPLGAPNLRRARRLAAGRHAARAIMYTCNTSDCLQRAEIVKANLHAIGIDVRIRRFPLPEMFRREFTGHQPYPYDIGTLGWAADYADPSNFLDDLFTDPTAPVMLAARYRRQIAATAKLTGDSISACTPASRSTRTSAAWPAKCSKRAVLPTPASPRITSTAL